MTVADVAVYLRATGWRPTSSTWRGAAVWARGEVEVLLPDRADRGDYPRRLRELVRTVAAVEGRRDHDVDRDIRLPQADTLECRPSPAGHPTGFTSLAAGLRALQGIHAMVVLAARAALDGPHLRFSGRTPVRVSAFAAGVELAGTAWDTVGYTALVPARARVEDGSGGITGREVVAQVHDAVTALSGAVQSGDPAAFDDTVGAGVSADFCTAVGGLGGDRFREPFEIGIRWAVGVPTRLAPRTIAFPPDAGSLIRAAARRLRKLDVSGLASVIGTVDGLHDDGTDRWRVRVRGELRTGDRAAVPRVIWVRLPDASAYEHAMIAHRDRLTVRAGGELHSRGGRMELLTAADALALTDNPVQDPEDLRAR